MSSPTQSVSKDQSETQSVDSPGGPSSPGPIAAASFSTDQPVPSSPAAPSDGDENKDEDDGDDLFGEEVDEAVLAEKEQLTRGEDRSDMSVDEEEDHQPRPSRSYKDPDASSESDDDLSESERRARNRLEYAEDDEEQQENEVREKTVVEIEAQKWDTFKGADGQRWNLRLPKHVYYESQPYDQETYQEPEEPVLPKEEQDQKLHAREIERRRAEELLRTVGHTVRWRWVTGEDGVRRQQSNTRIIRWSDGTLSLQLGHPSNLFTMVPHPDAQYPAQPTQYLVAHHYEAEIMQTEGPLAGSMNLVPVDMKGEMHKRLAKTVKERNMTKGRLKTWDEDKMVAANVGPNGEEGPQKKTRRSTGSGAKRKPGAGAGRKGYKEVASSRGGRRGSFGSDSSGDDTDAGDRRAKVRASAAGGGVGSGWKNRTEDELNGKGDYQNDGFVVDDDSASEAVSSSSSATSSLGNRRRRKRSSGSKSSKRAHRASPTLSSDEEPSAVESSDGSLSATSDRESRKKSRSSSSKNKNKSGERSKGKRRSDSGDDSSKRDEKKTGGGDDDDDDGEGEEEEEDGAVEMESEDMESESEEDAERKEIKKRRVVIEEDEEE